MTLNLIDKYTHIYDVDRIYNEEVEAWQRLYYHFLHVKREHFRRHTNLVYHIRQHGMVHTTENPLKLALTICFRFLFDSPANLSSVTWWHVLVIVTAVHLYRSSWIRPLTPAASRCRTKICRKQANYQQESRIKLF